MDLNMKSLRKGFTLIELLVVIAIIAILAAILFPVFAQAKMAAKQAAGISNQKQLLTSSIMYQADNDDVYHRLRAPQASFSACFTNTTCDQVQGWEDMLFPYIKSAEMFKSPIDSIARDDCSTTATWGAVSYSWNHGSSSLSDRETDTFGAVAYYDTQGSMSATALGAPAQMIVLYEFWGTQMYRRWTGHWRYNSREIGHNAAASAVNPASIPSWPRVLTTTWCSSKPNGAMLTMGNYNGKHIYGFADGHAKAMDRSAIMGRGWTYATAIANPGAPGSRNWLHYSGNFTN